jgi:hypothetical protein
MVAARLATMVAGRFTRSLIVSLGFIGGLSGWPGQPRFKPLHSIDSNA